MPLLPILVFSLVRFYVSGRRLLNVTENLWGAWPFKVPWITFKPTTQRWLRGLLIISVKFLLNNGNSGRRMHGGLSRLVYTQLEFQSLHCIFRWNRSYKSPVKSPVKISTEAPVSRKSFIPQEIYWKEVIYGLQGRRINWCINYSSTKRIVLDIVPRVISNWKYCKDECNRTDVNKKVVCTQISVQILYPC